MANDEAFGGSAGNIAQTAKISHAIMRVGSNLDDGLYERLEDGEYEIITGNRSNGHPIGMEKYP